MPERLVPSVRWMAHPFRTRRMQAALALGFLVLDYFAGAIYIQFPIAFIIPVALAAWYVGWQWATLLAIVQPFGRFCFNFVWNHPQPIWVSTINLSIRVSVLFLIAYLIQRTARQTRELRREVKLLEGILPICSYCKKIRDERDNWQQLESYIHTRTNADFSHGVCPECLHNEYAKIRRELGDIGLPE